MFKKLFFISVLSLVIVSCGTTVYQLQAPCNKSVETVLKETTGLLIKEGFRISFQSETTGLLQAASKEEYDIWSGYYSFYEWNIQIYNNMVEASCIVNYYQKNVFGAVSSSSETYLNDKTSEDNGYYWNIRDGFEDICNSRISIIKSKKGETKSGRKRTQSSEEVEGKAGESINE